MDTVYVHDDNLGSHAHYELFDSNDLNVEGHKKLMLRRGRSNRPLVSWWKVDEWAVEFALVPKPDKLRLPVQSLFLSVLFLRPLFEQVFEGLELHYAARFGSGVEYRRKLIELGVDPTDMRGFQFTLDLPRHVGIISVFLNDDIHLCDAILDVTEVERNPVRPSVVGFTAPGVPKNSEAWVRLANVAESFDMPLIAAPISP